MTTYTDLRAAQDEAEDAEEARALAERATQRAPAYVPFLLPAGPEDVAAAAALDRLADTRIAIRREMRKDKIESSFLGIIGRGLEPVTQYADFDWKINVALLSSFAARESSVATLGVLFDQDDGQNRTLEERMGAAQAAEGRTALSAVALLLFFALYPPCLATVMMVKIQTGSVKWMVFSIVFPTLLGLTVASVVFTTGRLLGLGGLQAMTAVYLLALATLILVALPKPWARMPAPRPVPEDGS